MITEKDCEELYNKMYEIYKIPKWDGNGQNWEGVLIDKYPNTSNTDKICLNGISFNWYNDAKYSFNVGFDELDKPIEYFEKKYADEIEKYTKLHNEEKKKRELEKEIKEREEYERLKQKFEK